MGNPVASTIDPWFVNSAITSNEARLALSALVGRDPASGITAETGVLPGGAPAAFLPTSNGTSGAPTVSVAPGHCVVATSAGGTYICSWPAATTVALTVPAANPRIDLLCARVRDTDVDASGVKKFEIIPVDGVPASSPTAPAVPAGYLPLYQIQVAASPSGALTITDMRTFTRASGGIRVVTASQLARAGSYVGDIRVQQGTGQIDVWMGSSWSILASPAVWTQFTPTLQYAGSPGPPSQAAGTVNLGSGASAVGRYIQVGKRLDINYTFVFGTTGLDGGSGAITTQLPGGFVSRAAAETHIVSYLFTGAGDTTSWGGVCWVPANSTTLQPRFSISPSDCRLGNYRIAGTAGTPGTGIPYTPGGYPGGPSAILSINGTIEIQ